VEPTPGDCNGVAEHGLRERLRNQWLLGLARTAAPTRVLFQRQPGTVRMFCASERTTQEMIVRVLHEKGQQLLVKQRRYDTRRLRR